MSSVEEDLGFDPSRFKLGVLCRRNHDWNEEGKSLRYLKCNSCVACKALKDRERQIHNLEKINEYNKRYRKDNPDKVREWNQRFWQNSPITQAQYRSLRRKRNPERFRELDQAQYLRHREKDRERRRRNYLLRKNELHAKQLTYMRTEPGRMLAARSRHRHRARVQAALHIPYTTFDLLQLRAAFDDSCAYCSQPARSIDHFIPIAKGGSDCLGNLLPCCRSCNSSKNNSDPYEWFSRQSFFSEQQ